MVNEVVLMWRAIVIELGVFLDIIVLILNVIVGCNILFWGLNW